MRGKRLSIGLKAALAIFLVTLLVTSTWATTNWTEKVLHSFHRNGTDGYTPQASLIFDAAGNLYGTTVDGGTYRGGTVFELTPQAGGGWTETVLHSFHRNGTDGASPYAGLVLDAAGNLYGTTVDGGTYGRGAVFELTPEAGGGWTEQVLHNFGNGTDGAFPYAGLVLDAAGNLYGTTCQGGTHGRGAVFELTPQAGGGWTDKVLHSFDPTDGYYPEAGLIFDAAGNLYGTTLGRSRPAACNPHETNGAGRAQSLSPSCSRAPNTKTLGTLGTLGTSSIHAGASVPNADPVTGNTGNNRSVPTAGPETCSHLFPGCSQGLGTETPNVYAAVPNVPVVPNEKEQVCQDAEADSLTKGELPKVQVISLAWRSLYAIRASLGCWRIPLPRLPGMVPGHKPNAWFA